MSSCFARIDSMNNRFGSNRSAMPIRACAILLATTVVGFCDPSMAAAQGSGSFISIDNFASVNNGDGTWTVYGQVDSAYVDPAGMTVWLGGLFSGHQAIVEDDGTFSYTMPLPLGMRGIVTAAVQDPAGFYDFAMLFLFTS